VVDVDGSTTDGGGCIYDMEPFSGFCSDQVKVEDENMKKSNKIKLSPIKGQARQIKVESPGSKSDSESKDQPKETTTVKQDAQEKNIGTSGATGTVNVPVEEENEAKLDMILCIL
jgi:hypothetical protein